MEHFNKILPVFLLSLLSACGSIQTTQGDGTLSKFDSIANQFSCKINDSDYENLSKTEQKALKSKEEQCFNDYGSNGELRLLRAELIATVLTRYGIAKIEDYSKNKEADAVLLVSRLNPLISKLKEAKSQLDNKNDAVKFSYYDVIKADLYVDFVELAIIATRPVRAELNNLLFTGSSSRIASGKKLLINALETSLYKEAYVNRMHQLRKAITSEATLYNAGWTEISREMDIHCKRIKQVNKSLSPQCDLTSPQLP